MKGTLEGTKWWKDDTKVSLVVNWDNRWEAHGQLTATLPDTNQQIDVLDFVTGKYYLQVGCLSF